MGASTSPTLPPEELLLARSGPPQAATVSRAPTAPAAVVHFYEAARARLVRQAGENLAYWRGFLEEGPAAFAPNLQTRPGIVLHDGVAWPLCVNDGIGSNSYPCSLHTQYVRYPHAELSLVPAGIQRLTARLGLVGMDGLLRIAKADRVVQWGSWLLSTNLHGGPLREAVEPVTRTLVSAFPKHAVLVKNLHGFEDPELPATFTRAGYQLITSRQVYFFDGRTKDFLTKSTVKREAKEFAQPGDYRVVEHDQFTAADVPRITSLYRQLYVEKHSELNPCYTERFVARAWSERWLEFRGLRHVSGRLDGVFACFTAGGTTSTPFIGYDTSLPADLGLYRHLVSLLLRRVAERGQMLNYSSGAGDFKRRRGGQPVIEFNAVYTRHLSPVRRAAFRVLAALANGPGRRFLEKNEI